MGSLEVFKWHIKIFKVCALWPPEGGSRLYSFYVFIYFLLVNTLFSFSQVICVLFVDSIDAVVDQLLLSCSEIMVSLKAYNFYFKYKPFVEMLRILEDLDKTITLDEHKQLFAPAKKRSNILVLFFLVNYGICWSFLVLQTVLAEPENRIWTSQMLIYPIEYPIIYNSGLIYQSVASCLMIISDTALDTYGVSLIDVINAHIDGFKKQLSTLGHSVKKSIENKTTEKDKINQEIALIRLCKKYNLILK